MTLKNVRLFPLDSLPFLMDFGETGSYARSVRFAELLGIVTVTILKSGIILFIPKLALYYNFLRPVRLLT